MRKRYKPKQAHIKKILIYFKKAENGTDQNTDNSRNR